MINVIMNFVKENYKNWLILVLGIFVGLNYYVDNYLVPPDVKDFKDGVQNHLIWSIKGECYFVRPETEKTVYLIRVVDCDKK
jgi:hypothetical protein